MTSAGWDFEWDEGLAVGGPAGPYRQSERLELYQPAHARTCWTQGKAYYAFETADELEALRSRGRGRQADASATSAPATLPTRGDAEAARAAGRPVVVRSWRRRPRT